MAVEMEQEIVAAPPMAAAPKKPTKAKVAKTKPTHPAWATMIEVAVKEMNEKGGSSIPAIKKFILSHNNTVDKVRLTSHMRRAVKTLTVNGTLVQAKGHGLTGSFKLGGLKTKAPKKSSAGATKNKKKSPKKEDAQGAPKTKGTSVAKKAKAVMSANPISPKVNKSDAPKAKKPVAKKASKPKEGKKAPAKPKAVKKVRAKPKGEKKAPSKVNKAAKNPKSPKPKTIKKVAAKPKAKPAVPK